MAGGHSPMLLKNALPIKVQTLQRVVHRFTLKDIMPAWR